MKTVAPFALFAVFVAIFWWQSRRAGVPMDEWLGRRNRETFTRPGWWRPMVVWTTLLVTVFIVVVTVQQGWRWQYLLVPVIVGGFLALSLPLMARLARRR